MRVQGRLGEHASLIRGITFRPSDKCSVDAPGAVVCLRTKNVQIELDETDLIAIPDTLIKNQEKIISQDDILVSSANSWNLVGKCCMVRQLGYRATAGGFISILRPVSDSLDSNYLYRWFSSAPVQSKVRSFGNQTTNIANLNHKRTLDLQIPLPPLTEQKRIAAILDTADALRSKRQAALAKLDDLVQATFLDMFGDPVTNPKGWEVQPLSSFIETIIDYRGKTPPKSPNGIPLLSAANVKKGKIDLSHKQFISQATYDKWTTRGFTQPGDVLITTEAPIGEVAPYPKSGVYQISRRVMALRPNNQILSDVLLFVLLSPSWHRRLSQLTRGSTVPRLLKPDILKQLVPILPKTDQRQFASIVTKIEEQKARVRAHLAELDTLFASLQSRAFKGEL